MCAKVYKGYKRDKVKGDIPYENNSKTRVSVDVRGGDHGCTCRRSGAGNGVLIEFEYRGEFFGLFELEHVGRYKLFGTANA